MCYSAEDRWNEWAQQARRRDLLAVIAEVAQGYHADESLQDAKARALTIMWLATRGEMGVYMGRRDPEDWLPKAA